MSLPFVSNSVCQMRNNLFLLGFAIYEKHVDHITVKGHSEACFSTGFTHHNVVPNSCFAPFPPYPGASVPIRWAA